MTSRAYLVTVEGLWGPFTDPGIFYFTKRAIAELQHITVDGPHRDYDVNVIVDTLARLPQGTSIILVGTSLGACNIPVIAARLQARRPDLKVYLFGFQASIYGAHAIIDTDYEGITSNVVYARLTSSDNPFNAGLGAQRWQLAPHNPETSRSYDKTTGSTTIISARTHLRLDTVNDAHPGDGNTVVQDNYLGDIKHIIGGGTL